MCEDMEIIYNNCRLCQKNAGTRGLLNSEEFVNKIMYCTNIQVNDDLKGRLPNTICSLCEINIVDFFVFLQKIKLVDKKLRDHVSLQMLDDLQTDLAFVEPSRNMTHLKCSVFKMYPNYYEPEIKDNMENNHTKEQLLQRKGFCQDLSTDCRTSPLLGNYNKDCLTCKCKITSAPNDSISEDSCTTKDTSAEEQETYGCDFCNKKFFISQDLYSHRETHTVQFICSYTHCNRICSSAYSLKTHLMKHEGKRPFLCVTCGKGFVTKNSLTCHEKIHIPVKSYTCKECNIGFSVSSNLRAHQRKHHEGIKFHCPKCPRTFIAKCSLQRHELLHTGIKEYKCQLCPAKFYTNKELLKHQRYHQGLRSYKCDQCFKMFFEKHHLTIHMRCHTGERPYVCTIANCKKSFTESQKLTRHMKSRHVIN